MSDSKTEFERLREEYYRLYRLEAAADGPREAESKAREKVREFCLATGADVSLLLPLFQEEDIWWVNFQSPG